MGAEIISARRGEGKTSFLREHVGRLAGAGRSVGGIASPAVFENGQRIGYDLLDLCRGSRRPLARVVTTADAAPTVGIYQFDQAAIKEGNAAIVSAVLDGLDVITVDEVGPLEIRGGGWAEALEFALRECDSQQELIVVVRPSLVDELLRHFPSPLWAAAGHITPPWPTSLPEPA